MSRVGYYYGYIQAIFYAPLFPIFGGNPLALYKAMLVVNGIIISFIPLLAYHLASKLGVNKVWQKIVIAFCSGLYITYVAHSKFIWNEAICSLLPFRYRRFQTNLKAALSHFPQRCPTHVRSTPRSL